MTEASRLMSKDELINAEAVHIATGLIEIELNKENLPLPKPSALDQHVTELLKNRPDIRETARARVEAKQSAYSESLAAVGIHIDLIEGVDL